MKFPIHLNVVYFVTSEPSSLMKNLTKNLHQKIKQPWEKIAKLQGPGGSFRKPLRNGIFKAAPLSRKRWVVVGPHSGEVGFRVWLLTTRPDLSILTHEFKVAVPTPVHTEPPFQSLLCWKFAYLNILGWGRELRRNT